MLEVAAAALLAHDTSHVESCCELLINGVDRHLCDQEPDYVVRSLDAMFLFDPMARALEDIRQLFSAVRDDYKRNALIDSTGRDAAEANGLTRVSD